MRTAASSRTRTQGHGATQHADDVKGDEGTRPPNRVLCICAFYVKAKAGTCAMRIGVLAQSGVLSRWASVGVCGRIRYVSGVWPVFLEILGHVLGGGNFVARIFAGIVAVLHDLLVGSRRRAVAVRLAILKQ